MKSYSQNAEDLFILNHFGNYKGTLLEIGANNGTDLSNSKLLLENGWLGWLVEPGQEFGKLIDLYGRYPEIVKLFNYGIGDKTEVRKFYQSGCHVPGGSDTGLVSTFDFEETKRWPNVDFVERELNLRSWNEFWESGTGKQQFDFISIDAEGFDWDILKQINLTDVGCKALCIEFNGDNELLARFSNYCALYGLKLAHMNPENLIFLK